MFVVKITCFFGLVQLIAGQDVAKTDVCPANSENVGKAPLNLDSGTMKIYEKIKFDRVIKI